MHTLSPKAYISIVFDEKYPIIGYIILDLELKYPLIAYIILELNFKYPLIAYIILGLKKVQNIFKPDKRLRIGSTLFYGRLWIWPIVTIVRINGSFRKNIDNFVLKYYNKDRNED